MPQPTPELLIPFEDVSLKDLPRVGGKNASLGELIRELRRADVRVPDGFALTVNAFDLHLAKNELGDFIYSQLDELDVDDTRAVAAAGRSIRERIAAIPLPAPLLSQMEDAYSKLSKQFGEESTDVAVRSSATAEDLPTASFAGQHETILNVRGFGPLESAVRRCMASLFTDRAIVYRKENGIAHREVSLSVGVQKMVRSDLSCSGVVFTLDTESGFRDVVLITGSWGLGELMVQGRVNPDEFWVHKATAKLGFRPILRRELGQKARKLIYAEGNTRSTREVRVPMEDRLRYILGDDEILKLARWAISIEEHYSKKYGRPTPMDIEWAKDGSSGELFILQARPETVHSKAGPPQIEIFEMHGKGKVLVQGKSVGNKVGVGAVRSVQSTEELHDFQRGDVLVTEMTDPDWEPILRKASAVVTEQGGRTCHAAIVSREIGIPCIVGTGNATELLQDGQIVTVSCAEGEEGKVYEGKIEFKRETIDPATLPKPRVPLMLNLANPANAFRIAQLPNSGVGLMRVEFLVNNWIGIHPMALIHPERVQNQATLATIKKRTASYSSPTEFFIEKLASGIAQIAASFYPKPVIVRFSDFKTNEYAGLLGGDVFEPVESNPMIGFRGAARYYDPRYREGFALECSAIHRVRETMGLNNVKVMIPFCRTLEEGRKVIQELEKNGLRRGQEGLEVYVMCEIPSNVVLAAEFSDLFDGFSIGSNDLTQLTLGIDRDSETLTGLFDERDLAVKRLITSVVETAHKKGKKVGICGQAPSDYPEFAEFLVSVGIDSISLNPDSLLRVAQRIAK